MVDNMLRSSNKVGIRVDYIYKLIIHSLLFPLRLGLLVVYTRFTMTLSATYANGFCWCGSGGGVGYCESSFLEWYVFRGPGGFNLCCTHFFGLILQLSIKFRKILFNIDDILVLRWSLYVNVPIIYMIHRYTSYTFQRNSAIFIDIGASMKF